MPSGVGVRENAPNLKDFHLRHNHSLLLGRQRELLVEIDVEFEDVDVGFADEAEDAAFGVAVDESADGGLVGAAGLGDAGDLEAGGGGADGRASAGFGDRARCLARIFSPTHARYCRGLSRTTRKTTIVVPTRTHSSRRSSAKRRPPTAAACVYLGAAPGVGKTYAMLQEGRRRAKRGTDVVVGYVETYERPLTKAALEGLEVISRRRIEYHGVVLEEMDTDAVIARRPQVALVDELAHTNAPGSKHEKRWQDVYDLLDARITVIST